MIIFILCIFIIFTTPSTYAFNASTKGAASSIYEYRPGNEKDDGGNLIFCSQSSNKESVEEGYYMLDYIYALFSSHYAIPQKFNSTEKYLDHIEEALKRISPYLHSDFKKFRRSIPSPSSNFSAKGQYRWVGNKAPLKKIPPPQFRRHLLNCSEDQIFQLVRRQRKIVKRRSSRPMLPIEKERSFRIIFHYNSEYLREIRKKPLQESFLIVHEWLWNFLDDPIDIYEFNAFLHSKEIELGLFTWVPTNNPSPLEFAKEKLEESGFRNEWVFLSPQEYEFHKSVENFIKENYRTVQLARQHIKKVKPLCMFHAGRGKNVDFVDFFRAKMQICQDQYKAGNSITVEFLSLKVKFEEILDRTSEIKVEKLKESFLQMLSRFQEIEAIYQPIHDKGL